MAFLKSDNLYNGASITAEQFLFYEMRIVARFYLQGKTIDEVVEAVRVDNLFQYPTERQVSRLSRACYKRLAALKNEQLVREIADAPAAVAKQIILYSMMRNYQLVRDFMISVVGEKYKHHDYAFSRKDINVFISRLQEQNESVATWSDLTLDKIKQVLTKCLVEAELLDSIKATSLNTIYICEELLNGIRENNDSDALIAFNYFG